jgi:hypothetical protein
MDRVRFGRALGFGARLAVKTLVTAADAATATNPTGNREAETPNSGQVPSSRPATKHVDTTVAPLTAARSVKRAREVKGGLRQGGKRFGEALWGPFVRLSGVLWLEVSGVFFGIFALFALAAVIRLHGQWHAGSAERQQLFCSVAMLALFGYFCVSNFVRARRRERRR